MELQTQVYELNTPDIAAELLEHEVMAIDFKKGLYYSLRDSAAAIWELVINHHSTSSIVSQLESHLENAVSLIPEFIQKLEQYQLIRKSLESPKAVVLNGLPEIFQAPQLEEFDDMQDLLLLDPIHEVEPSLGWPFANKG